MKIYGFPTFNFTKVLITAEELGLDYEIQWMDPRKGELKAPEYLDKHPLGKVPCLELDGHCYFESMSICRLLAERSGNQLYGDTPELRAQVNQWMDLTGYHAGRWISSFFFQELVKPKLMGLPADADALTEAQDFLDQQLPVIDKTLREREFLVRNELTLADIMLFSYLQTKELTSLSLEAYPAIQSWYQRMEARPAVARAMSKCPGGHIYAPFKD